MKDFSSTTQAYILGIVFLGGVLATWQLTQFPPAGSALLVIAVVIASLLQGLAVIGATARSSYSLSWIVFAFSLVQFGPSETLLVMMVSFMVEWLLERERLKWYIQTFNVGTFIIAIVLSGQLINLGHALVSPESVLSFLIVMSALALFTLVNHLLVGLVLLLARGQNLAQSGVFGLFTLILDFTLLALGFTGAIIWDARPVALLLVGMVAYLIYEALKVPALERKVEMDPKTELFNARYFSRALAQELDRANRFNRPLAIIMADLDLLRNINNTYGHLAGDVVLQGVASILMKHARPYDIVARFGGEEFSILMPETSADEALLLAEKMRQAIASYDFVVSTSLKPVRATMSFGISSRKNHDFQMDALIHNADVALYQAKENGRNCVSLFNESTEPTKIEKKKSKHVTVVQNEREPAPAQSGPHQDGAGIFSDIDKIAELLQNNTILETSTKTVVEQIPYSTRIRNLYIGGLTIVSGLLAFVLVSHSDQPVIWIDILLFVLIIFLAEVSSLEIYARDTTVSTSVAPLIAGVILFGPIGAVVFGFTIAFSSFAKRRTPIYRLVFNSSNHIIGGLLVVAILKFFSTSYTEWSIGQLLFISIGAAALIYLSSTLLLTGAITITSAQSFRNIWMERFNWLLPYYLALGVIAAILVYSYMLAAFIGTLVILIPLILLRYSQMQYIDHTEDLVSQLRAANIELKQSADEVTQLNEDLLLTLARSVDLRDPYVMEHSKHVSRYAVSIARELGLSGTTIEEVRKAGLLHDIGKLGIPESILFKPDKLTAAEFNIVKEHAAIGAELLKGCQSLVPLVPYVRHHHEWFNGTGYPDGLVGDDSPLVARILGVADAVEAMASDRPYRAAMSPQEILDEVQDNSGTQFDPGIVSAFASVIEREGEQIIVNSARDVINRQADGQPLYLPHY